MQIYIVKSGQQAGPYSREQINAMINEGSASLSDLSWRNGLPDWQPLHLTLGTAPPLAELNKDTVATAEAQFFYIPTSRLILLSLISFGLFNNYWVYKNWKYIKNRDGLDIMPFWRGIWCLFHFHSLLKYIKEDAKTSRTRQATYSPGWLTAGFVICIITGNKMIFPALLGFLFFLPAHHHIAALNESNNAKAAYVKWSFGQILCVAFIPAMFIVGIIIGIADAINKRGG